MIQHGLWHFPAAAGWLLRVHRTTNVRFKIYFHFKLEKLVKVTTSPLQRLLCQRLLRALRPGWTHPVTAKLTASARPESAALVLLLPGLLPHVPAESAVQLRARCCWCSCSSYYRTVFSNSLKISSAAALRRSFTNSLRC